MHLPEEIYTTLSDDFIFNSTEFAVYEALNACPTSNSSPDGISFKLLKSVAGHIIRPLNIVFQHSLHDGTFPQSWKHAVVIPIYKGKGDRSSSSNYRPVSMCSCLGKLLEKVIHTQLITFLNNRNSLHTAQHGFTSGRSTLTNLLEYDVSIADCLAMGHPYDIITFDFSKAFDKLPHQCVIDAMVSFGIRGKALKWLSSFLTERTQQVKVGNSLSDVCDVLSGVVQGSVLGPIMYVMATNSLLAAIKLPCGAFADDLKFIVDVVKNTRNTAQDNIDIVANWAEAHHMPISIEKSGVMHCGRNQPNHEYMLCGHPMACMDKIVDLGVIRSLNSSYSDQCQAVATKAMRTANVIRRCFCTGAPKLLWPAFQSYVSPLLMYCSPVWTPNNQRDIAILERVQRRFTKSIRGMRDLSYTERLHSLGALTLQHRRLFADMTTAFKSLRGLMNCSSLSLGLALSTSNTREGGVRLTQRKIVSKVHRSLFCCRSPTEWNNLPLEVINCQSLAQFKRRLLKFVLIRQNS